MPKRAARPLDLGFDSDTDQAPSLTRLFAASTAKESEMQRATMIELDRLADNPFQPRLDMDEQALEELAQVMKLQGFQGVLIARPAPAHDNYYQLTAGHRRREAAKRAGLRVLPVVVQELSDEEMVVRAITENIQREDLSPLEEGKIYLLMSEEMGYTYAQIAKEVGKTVSYVRNRLGVARAPEDVQSLVQKKPDTLRAVIYLNKVEDAETRTEIIEQILAGTLATDDIPAYIEELRSEVGVGEQTVGQQVPEQASPEAPATAGIQVVPQEAPAEAMSSDTDVTATTQETEPVNRSDTGQSTLTPSADVGTTTPVARIVQIDGVSTIVEQDPKPLPKLLVEDEERRQLRVRASKLTSAIRTLVTYENLLAGGPSLLADEIGRLTRIASLVEGILARTREGS